MVLGLKENNSKLHVNPSTVHYARNGLFMPPSLYSSIAASFYNHTIFRRFNKVTCLIVNIMREGKESMASKSNRVGINESLCHA